MKPSNETIEKFQNIYFEEFKEEISREEAYEKFLRLVNLLRVILRPSKKGQDTKHPDSLLSEFDELPRNDKIKNHL